MLLGSVNNRYAGIFEVPESKSKVKILKFKVANLTWRPNHIKRIGLYVKNHFRGVLLSQIFKIDNKRSKMEAGQGLVNVIRSCSKLVSCSF